MKNNDVYLVLIDGNTLDDGAVGRVQKLLYDDRACGGSGDATYLNRYTSYGLPYIFFTNKQLTREQGEKIANTFMNKPVPLASLDSPHIVSILYGDGESLTIKLIGSVVGNYKNKITWHF